METEKIRIDLSQLNFTAIDFETANEQRTSACSMGMVVVRNGSIVKQEHYLVRPHEMRFTPINTSIHGMDEQDVAHAPEFNHLWERIGQHFHHEIILAHNASFDLDVLRKTLDSYHLSQPVLRYACTQKLAQHAFFGLSSYRLADVAAHLGIPLKHHHALADAHAAAQIGIRAIPEISPDLLDIGQDELTAYISKQGAATRKSFPGFNGKKVDSHLLKPDLEAADPNNPFYNKKVVFTGDLQSMSRKEAAERIRQMGADIDTAITGKTQIVIMGQKAGPAKVKKIEELKAGGSEIRVVEEEEFRQLIQ